MYRQRPAGHALAAAITLATLAPAASALAQATAIEDDLDVRLERLCAQLEERREELHIPGMAIAVVLNDEIVLARGFGVADIETRRPVSDETIFAIGSSTKAMTATAVGMLVDDGIMGWDDPVTKHLPYFELAIDGDDDDYVTIRDLLSHRTGFARMGILWAGGAVPRAEVLRVATGAEPLVSFRSEFKYNNVMFLAAGVAAGVAADSTWDELMRSRILDPLGMDDASTTITVAQKDDRIALGYRWDEDLDDYVHLPMRNLDTIAPAGAVNAHVRDMAQWVRLQLGNGAIDGRRLVSEAAIAETRTNTRRIAGDVWYGLGWMLRDWQGQPEVEHGGNIDGFAAQVSLLPESQLGYVLLMNVTASPLQGLSKGLVWNALLTETEPVVAESDEIDLDDYVGMYIANFASFRDERFEVSIVDAALAVNVPGQTNYVLRPPNDEGLWPFDMLPDQIQVSFDTNDDGAVVGMKMYQSGMTFELPREGVAIVAEVDENEIAKYLGSYRFEQMNAEVEVLVQNGRLALDIPGQMVFELHPPDDEGRRAFRAMDGVTVMFNEDESNGVTSLTLNQMGQPFELPRVAASRPADLPDLDAFMDRVRGGAREPVSDRWHFQATVRFANAGVTGDVEIFTDGLGRFRSDTTLGRFGEIHIALDGERGWSDSTFAPFQELLGNLLLQAREGHPLTLVADWRDIWETVELRSVDELDGRAVLLIRVRNGDAPPTTFFVDRESGDALKATGAQIAPGIGAIPVEIRFSDYREVGGVRYPHRIVTESEGTGIVVTEFTKITQGVDVSGVRFELVDEE